MDSQDKLDRIPEEVRARLAAMLLKSIGTGPIQAPDDGSEAPPDEDVELEFHDGGGGGALAELAMLIRPRNHRRSATLEEVADLNHVHVPPLQVGDKVRWRGKHHRMGDWPDENETAIVSQVFAPYRDPTACNETQGAHVNDIALAFADTRNRDGEDGPARVFEFVFDSRRFIRVNEE